jgi:hypothetical protein
VLRERGFFPVYELTRVKAVGGVATFKNVSVGQAGAYQLTAVTDGFAFGISDPFTISGKTPSKPAARPGECGLFFGY